MHKILFILLLPVMIFSNQNLQLDNYFDKNPEIMLIIDASSGDIVRANSSASKFYGYSVDELESMKIQDINIFTKEQVREEMREAANEKRNFFIFRHKLASGKTKRVRVFSYPYNLDGKKVLISSIHDTSKLELAQNTIQNYNEGLEDLVNKKIQELKDKNKIIYAVISFAFLIALLVIYLLYRNIKVKEKNEQKLLEYRKVLEDEKNTLETIFETNIDGIAILDLNSNFLKFNSAYLKMTGFTRDELMSKNCLDLTVDDDYEKAKSAVSEVMEKGIVKNFEKRCIIKGGGTIDVNLSMALMPDKKTILISAKDISQLKEKDRQIKEYLHLIDENILSSSTDLDGKITFVSNAFCEMTGYSKQELIGQTHSIIKHPDTPESLFKELWDTIVAGKIFKGDMQGSKKDGTSYWTNVSISPIYDKEHNKTGYTAIRHDISDKKLIEEISIKDPLTNIYNRRYFNEIIPKVLKSSKRDNSLFNFIMIDIDHFKKYNDTYGHQMGDEVLVDVTSAIKNSLNRADDYCFRLGGEEFGVFFKSDTQENSYKIADRIRTNVEELKIKHSKSTTSNFVTISLGLISKNANDIKDLQELYKQADELLYKAKEQGRNRVVVS
jgi:diguanylate cyclase (GGDEF)-like protein/PAS domain S-box-containing protein